MFSLKNKSNKSQARTGVLKTAHGSIETPFFMPIATKAAIKSLTVREVKDLGAQIILSNTYHNLLKPGTDIIKKFGGLHKYMDNDLPMLTDSGGYQVFSLSKFRKIKGNNIEFQSHIDGKKYILNPKKVIDIQVALGSDIMMVLDECVGIPVSRPDATKALERTSDWAQEAIDYKKKLSRRAGSPVGRQLIFGIVQGADFKDLRMRSARELVDINFDGYAVGGLAVGEPAKTMYKVLDYTVPELPEKKARYLMGVGYPENIIESVKRGIDMFDCVIPTREARHGRLYIRKTKSLSGKFYETINITNAKWNTNKKLLANGRFGNYSMSYVHHLFKTQESLGQRLATLNNLSFYLDMMKDIRLNIKNNKL